MPQTDDRSRTVLHRQNGLQWLLQLIFLLQVFSSGECNGHLPGPTISSSFPQLRLSYPVHAVQRTVVHCFQGLCWQFITKVINPLRENDSFLMEEATYLVGQSGSVANESFSDTVLRWQMLLHCLHVDETAVRSVHDLTVRPAVSPSQRGMVRGLTP